MTDEQDQGTAAEISPQNTETLSQLNGEKETAGDDIAPPPLLETTGLELRFWPAWAPVPRKALFVPFFSIRVSALTSNLGKPLPSFSTTLDADDILTLINKLATILEMTTETTKNASPIKILTGSSKEDFLEELQKSRRILDDIYKTIIENDIIEEGTEESKPD